MDQSSIATLFVVFITAFSIGMASDQHDNNQFRCMDTARHKQKPTRELGLYNTCDVYSPLSCCTNETAVRVHGKSLYHFDKLTCNKPMSNTCRKFFLKSACFFECSPHLSHWLVEDKINQVWMRDVPLCQSDCDNWFSACMNDFTCTYDWKAAHEHSTFHCTEMEDCQTFKKRFLNADSFCKKVWGGSYKVVPDDQYCLKIDASFDSRMYAHGFHHENSSCQQTAYFLVVVLTSFLATKL